MDWLTTLAIAEGWEQRRREKAEKEQNELMGSYWKKISEALFQLDALVADLVFPHMMTSMEMKDTDDLKELIRLFPFMEILSMQGYIGAEQRAYLQNYISIEQFRYNLGQIVKAATEREGIYPEWYAAAGLEPTHCGKIWHTLIELICRERVPERLQEMIDRLGEVYYYFHFLEMPDTISVEAQYKKLISSLNIFAESDQKTPYMHGVLLLQKKLAEKYGGTESDYIPCFDEEGHCDMDGKPGLRFSVHRKDSAGGVEAEFSIRFYTVQEIKDAKDADLIWEDAYGQGPPSILFSEEDGPWKELFNSVMAEVDAGRYP